MIHAAFAPRVGVAPGTTTVALNDGGPEQFVCLGNGGPCLPEPSSPYMTHSGSAAILPSAGAPNAAAPGSPVEVASIPYGTESELKDYGVHLLGDSSTFIANLPWGKLAIAGAALAGLVYLARRRA